MNELLNSYCNPLPIPEIPVSRCVNQPGYQGTWWREFGDPTVIRFKSRYYLFPSCGMVWYSDDLLNWKHHDINLNDVGWAPTVAEKDGRLYLTASWEGSRIWTTEDPLGLWEDLGAIKDEKGNPLYWADPALFTDVDGTLYCYYSLGVNRGLWGGVLLADDPTRFAAKPTHLFSFNPDNWWERFGENNQNPYLSHLEGASMTLYRGRYYLQYSAAGAEWRNYCVGCYVGDGPLGPFKLQRRNPILIQRCGMLNGCGHNSMVEDDNGNLWCFYTVLMRRYKGLERRIAMDMARVDGNGEIYVDGPTETPTFLDGTSLPELYNLSAGQPVTASSYVEDHTPDLAVDNYIRTHYQAESDDMNPTLTVDLLGEFNLMAARIIFDEKIQPGKVFDANYQFLLEGTLDGESYFILKDCRASEFDGHIRYETFESVRAAKVRITITQGVENSPVGIRDFAIFGRASGCGYLPESF